jgi:hypothetical protein
MGIVLFFLISHLPRMLMGIHEVVVHKQTRQEKQYFLIILYIFLSFSRITFVGRIENFNVTVTKFLSYFHVFALKDLQ